MKLTTLCSLSLLALSARTLTAQAPAEPPASPAPSGSADTRPKNQAATPGRAVWATSFDEAKQRAKQENKVVFVEFWKKGCGNCFRMDGLVYPSANFEMALLRAVPVKLDMNDPEAIALAKRYGVNDVPAVLMVSPGGAIIFRMVGFESDRAFYVHLHNSMADWDKVNLKLVHEPETIGDPKSQLELGKELFQRMDSEEAIPRFERASTLPKAPLAVREEALSYLASAQMELERFAPARATIEKLLRIAKNPDVREKAELFRGQISLGEGKPEQARKEFQAFLTKHPSSKRRDQAKAYLARLDGGSGAPSK